MEGARRVWLFLVSPVILLPSSVLVADFSAFPFFRVLVLTFVGV